jgi:hypothetical protein
VNRYDTYSQAEPNAEEWQRREETREREAETSALARARASNNPDAIADDPAAAAAWRAEQRAERNAALPVVHLQPYPQPIIKVSSEPAPPKTTGATPHQMKSNLLGMCATADRFFVAGRNGDFRRQREKIALREAELRIASPEIWPLYERDRDAEQLARRCAAIEGDIITRVANAPADPPEYGDSPVPGRPGYQRTPAPEPTPPPTPKPAPVTPPARPAPKDTRTTLDCAVEMLVAEYSSGAVIDAAWAAAHRLFKPNREKAA